MKEFWHLPNRFSTSPYRMSYFCRVSPLLAEGFLSTFRSNRRSQSNPFSPHSLSPSLPFLLPSSLPSNSHTDSSTQPLRLSSATQAHTHTSFDTSPPHSEDQRPILRWIEKRVRGKPRDNRAERGLPARMNAGLRRGENKQTRITVLAGQIWTLSIFSGGSVAKTCFQRGDNGKSGRGISRQTVWTRLGRIGFSVSEGFEVKSFWVCWNPGQAR